MHLRIGVICSGWAFMDDILQELRRYHSVLILNEPFTNDRVESFMKDLDVLYVEWCDSYMLPVTHVEKSCRIICRLHGNEVYGRWISEVDFSKIDTLVFINDFWRDNCLRLHKTMLKSKAIKVIQLGVDVEKFNYDHYRGYGKRLGWVGYIKPRKDPISVLDMMRGLPDWVLHFLAIPSLYADLTQQVETLMSGFRNVFWYKNWVGHEGMPEFYENLDVFVNSSILEGQGVAILEAMSCGIHSLIRRWPHAEEIYPEKNLYNSVAECKSKILEWVKKPVEEKKQISLDARKFIIKYYNARDYVRKMREAIEQV